MDLGPRCDGVDERDDGTLVVTLAAVRPGCSVELGYDVDRRSYFGLLLGADAAVLDEVGTMDADELVVLLLAEDLASRVDRWVDRAALAQAVEALDWARFAVGGHD